jgi:hypothetical protein
MTTAGGTRGQAVDESCGFLMLPVDETKAAVVKERNLMMVCFGLLRRQWEINYT